MVGIDIVSVKKFQRIQAENRADWEKIFAIGEWEYCFGSAHAPERLAGIFAAKEAVMKAAGGDLMKRFDRIEIRHEEDGRPVIYIDGERSAAEVSISHDGGFAAAFAVVPHR
ncbi:4'-phosphopantetheinyl transferase superfamily protein [bacterium]|nr:4'-phosphopantetheinyl transferase superfamily protein [bacterium]MCI0565764.1 4'-phosphopantetheinyl transferase superfamily protein [bacterium]MCI0680111.1 4'-phosphopantetheinyl transferase superfamily protein [bacterium]